MLRDLAAAADAGEDRRVAGSGAVLRIERHVVGTAGMLHVLQVVDVDVHGMHGVYASV